MEFEDESSFNGVAPTSSSSISSQKNVFFRCNKCPYQTKFQSLLARHEAKHALDRPFLCSECNFSEYDHSAFVDHWVTHQPTKVIRCAFCSFKCKHPNSLKMHIPTHRPTQMLDCTMCEYSSNFVQSMKSHIEKNHTTDESKNLNPVLVRRSGLGCGIVGHRNCNCSPDSPEEPDEVLELPPRKQETDDFRCPLCEFTAVNPLSLRYHTVVFHKKKVSCDHCPAVMTKHDLIQHALNEHCVNIRAQPVPKHDDLTLDESGCPDVETPVSPTVLDMIGCAGKAKEFECAVKVIDQDLKVRTSEESKELDSIDVAKAQNSLVHDASVGSRTAKIFRCTVCKYSASRRGHLEAHSSRCHIKKYFCNFCSAIMTRYELEEHCLNVHGSKLINRNLREALLVSPDSVRTSNLEESGLATSSEPHSAWKVRPRSTRDHQLANRANRCAKRFKCPSCQFSSSSKIVLQKHKEGFHKKKYPCKHCKAVLTKHSLLIHSKKKHGVVKNAVRTGDRDVLKAASPKTYDCSLCQYSSLYVVSYERHVESFHTKKYPCSQCSVPDMTKYELMKHSEKAHGVILKQMGRRSLGGELMHNNGPDVPDVTVSGSDSISRADSSERSSSLPVHLKSGYIVSNPEFKNPKSTLPKILVMSKVPASESEYLQCSNCSFQTKLKFQMSRHVRLHLPEGQFECPKCNFRESNIVFFAKHAKSHSKSEGTLDCCFCSYSSTRLVAFKSHLCKHRDIDSYYCSKCKYSCKFRSTLSLHVQKYHAVKHTCPECRKCGTKLWFIQHLKKCHPSSESTRLSLESKGQTQNPKLKIKKQGRVGCSSLKSNVKKRIAAKKAFCSKISFNREKTEEKGLLRCKTCEYRTAREDLLQRHEAKHEPLECPVCGLKISSGYRFTVHLTQHNPPNMLYKCFYCGYIAKRIGNLEAHLSRHLGALKKFDCSKCEFSHFRSDYLKQHILAKHSQADGAEKSEALMLYTPKPSETATKSTVISSRPLTSTVRPSSSSADLTYGSPQSMAVLVRGASQKAPLKFGIGNGFSGKKPLVCSKCNYQTARGDLLLRHQAKHVPIECPLCKLKFRKGFAFASHLSKHNASGSRYNCFYCTYIGKCATSLYLHLSSHLDALKTRDCSECEYSCVLYSDLKKHQAVHTKNNSSASRNLQEVTAEAKSERLKKLSANKLGGRTTAAGCLSKKSSPGISPKRSVYSVVDLVQTRGSGHGGEVSSHIPNQFQCLHCDFKTLREDLLQRHLPKHEPLVCPVCDSSVRDHSRFAAHLADHNPASAPFRCHYCDHVPRKRTHFFYHLAVHIDALKIFDCPFCEFCFNRPDVLRNHLISHRIRKSRPSKSVENVPDGSGPVGVMQVEVESSSVSMNPLRTGESPDTIAVQDMVLDSDLFNTSENDVATETVSVGDTSEPSELLDAPVAQTSSSEEPSKYHDAYPTCTLSASDYPESLLHLDSLTETDMEIDEDLSVNVELDAAETAPSAATSSEPCTEALEAPVAPMTSTNVSSACSDACQSSSPILPLESNSAASSIPEIQASAGQS